MKRSTDIEKNDFTPSRSVDDKKYVCTGHNVSGTSDVEPTYPVWTSRLKDQWRVTSSRKRHRTLPVLVNCIVSYHTNKIIGDCFKTDVCMEGNATFKSSRSLGLSNIDADFIALTVNHLHLLRKTATSADTTFTTNRSGF